MRLFQFEIAKYFIIPLAAVFSFNNQLAFSAESQSLDMPKKELEVALKYALITDPLQLKPFHLKDQNNKPFGLNELKGKWTFMYFGYTSCPDVCPTTIDELNIVSKKLAEDHRYEHDTQYVFVSVDPERDTPDMLKKFTDYFEFNLQGAVAPIKDLNTLTYQLGVLHRLVPVAGGKSKHKEYTVEHSSDIYLINPQGKAVARFSPPHYGKEIKQLYVMIRQLQAAGS
jgi:cytochrome oxidase Cu insertion factor (SCO1/SenC/PrrC family)